MDKYLRSVVDHYLSHASFNESNVGQNLLKIFVIGGIYTVFECVGLTLSTLGYFHSDIRMYVFAIVLFHIIYLPFLAVSYRRKWFKRIGVYELLTNLYYVVALTWASVFTALMYLTNEDITIYSIVLFLLSALFIIEPNRSSVIYLTNFMLFAGLVYSIVTDMGTANGLVFKSLIVCALALVISHGNYIARKNLWDSKESLQKANDELKEMAIKDSLTELYNNKYIFETLELKTRNAKQTGEHLSLIMIDIDNFKRINDTFGHLFGDRVIREVSQAILDSTRDTDIPGRYGGEEFIIVLSDTPKAIAMEIAERIREKVEGLEYDENIHITVSIGVSEMTEHSPNFLVGAADINLYKAKHQGKNRVVA